MPVELLPTLERQLVSAAGLAPARAAELLEHVADAGRQAVVLFTRRVDGLLAGDVLDVMNEHELRWRVDVRAIEGVARSMLVVGVIRAEPGDVGVGVERQWVAEYRTRDFMHLSMGTQQLRMDAGPPTPEGLIRLTSAPQRVLQPAWR